MNRLMLGMIGAILLCYGIYNAYWPWIEPDEYLKRRQNVKSCVKTGLRYPWPEQ